MYQSVIPILSPRLGVTEWGPNYTLHWNRPKSTPASCQSYCCRTSAAYFHGPHPTLVEEGGYQEATAPPVVEWGINLIWNSVCTHCFVKALVLIHFALEAWCSKNLPFHTVYLLSIRISWRKCRPGKMYIMSCWSLSTVVSDKGTDCTLSGNGMHWRSILKRYIVFPHSHQWKSLVPSGCHHSSSSCLFRWTNSLSFYPRLSWAQGGS